MSGQVRLPQVGATIASEYVALRLPSPGVVVTCIDTGSKADPPRIAPFSEEAVWWSNSLPQATHGYRGRSDGQPATGGRKHLAVDALSQRERLWSVSPEDAEGIAASRAATTGRWLVPSTIQCWAGKLTVAAATARSPINYGAPGESNSSAVRCPIVRPGCPGRDDLPAVRRAAQSGQVVDGPALVAKASSRGTRAPIRRP